MQRKSNAEKRQEARERLEESVRALATLEGWKLWFETCATFHQYSLGNTMLIAMQRPEATQVAGFKAWQKLERQVRKGERGIRIMAPHTGVNKDAVTGEEERYTYFVSVSVFDIAQTDGEPLPSQPHEPITGDSHARQLPVFERFAGMLGYTVSFEELGGLCEIGIWSCVCDDTPPPPCGREPGPFPYGG